MSVREFLKPDKKKITIALVMPALHWFVLNLFVQYVSSLSTGTQFQILYYPPEMYLVGSLLLMVLSPLYYPFACSIVVLWDYKRYKLKLTRKMKILIALGFVIFNPISVRWMILLVIWMQIYFFGRTDLIKFLHML